MPFGTGRETHPPIPTRLRVLPFSLSNRGPPHVTAPGEKGSVSAVAKVANTSNFTQRAKRVVQGGVGFPEHMVLFGALRTAVCRKRL